MAGRVVLAANSSWNIVNFRAGLIRGLRAAGYDPIVVAPVDPTAEHRMGELGVERIALRIDRAGVNPFADLQLLFRYRTLLKKLRPFAFLSFTIKPNIYGSLAAASLGIPAVPNVSGLGTAFIRRGPLQMIVTRLYQLAFRGVPTVFFQNPDDRQLFLNRGIVELEQTRLLPGSGVDLDHFAPAPQEEGPTTFLLISRLLGDKGIREYAEAARLLRDTIPGARFQLLGPIDAGNRTAIRQAELDSWVSEGVIDYLGTTDDVRPFIEQASAVVLPSYREGLPRSLLEAAAMARPLIATNVAGCREVVADGANGFLCSAGDPVSLAGAMLKFAELTPEQRNALGSVSRQRVQERFSEAVVIRAYLDVLGKLGAGQG